ncbi:hypothetical protein C8F04DRAFT_1108868 [Mycena alexandri]|uniref:Uncharacterized protein n=1 Tax=Mycena alexandri TaxID=1745969 RepID=A0AAD6X162_9AGAR|nr:hypothetical protein C8F04DRAFT_1108868 [Mycena alexandri]
MRPNLLPSQFLPLYIRNERMSGPEDILNDALEFLGGNKVVEDEVITYGDLRLTVAAKEGKANTLLADHLFSPGLFFAERIERGLLPAHELNVVELGAGCALPSLLMSTVASPPAIIVVTDYPDPGILGNLTRNVDRNSHLVTPGCTVRWCGYDWGTDAAPLLMHTEGRGYDLVILSDLLHFHSSHPVLIASAGALLARSPDARVHVAAGNYTKPDVCDDFLRLSLQAGFVFDEILPSDEEREWMGTSAVSGLDKMGLATRKGACRYWVGRRG